MFEAIFYPSFRCAPKARARNPYSLASRLNRITGVMGPRLRGDDNHDSATFTEVSGSSTPKQR